MTYASNCAMIFRFRRRIGSTWVSLIAWWGFAVVATAADEVVNTRDILVYKDGDRVHGKLVQNAGGTIVFRADRFGELRVPAADAVVIKAEEPAMATPRDDKEGPPPTVAAPSPNPTPAEEAEVERATIWDRFSPSVLTAKVREFFGPWHGRLAFSTEIVSDVAERHNLALEGQLRRKWERDEVQISARYDYAKTNDAPTTDMIKASGSWRREFNKKLFAHYRPTAEWNRASKRKGVPNDYVLLQQEIGAGFHVVTKPTRKLRLGVAQNFFDIWNTAPDAEHTSRGAQSAFEEIELKLPWQMGLTQRGLWYPVADQRDGWENRIELNKKLTETLSTALRHEIRRHNPDGSAQDYERLKLLFGLDF